MRLKVLMLALFVAGAGSSYALAAPGGHGKPPKKGETTASTGTTTTTAQAGTKVTLCHQAGKSGRWVKITVSVKAQKAHLRRGDVAPDASGACPASTKRPKHGGTTTTTTTTTSS